MNIDMFSQQVKIFQQRLTHLYQNTNTKDGLPVDSLIPSLFKELGTSSEELQVAGEELLQQTEELVVIRQQLEAERQSYKNLFEFMPQGYLVTDAQGKILQANRAAATLLGVEPSLLQGKLLVTFVPSDKRSEFRAYLTQLQKCQGAQTKTLCLQPRRTESFQANVTISPVCESDKLTSLCWVLYDITYSQRVQLPLSLKAYSFTQEYSASVYFKGDIIPLKPDQLWIVRHGLVKLSTMNECGQEVLVGLAGSSMPFGSGLTDLPTYQAIALSSQVELICLSVSEIAASPKLTQALLPQISQRLRQTETLLAISGKRQVQERFHHLLLFFKQQFGQPVAGGTCLSIRFTHQDFAEACCTTRVTITRLMSKLQKQGKIKVDSRNHILFPDASEARREKYLNVG